MEEVIERCDLINKKLDRLLEHFGLAIQNDDEIFEDLYRAIVIDDVKRVEEIHLSRPDLVSPQLGLVNANNYRALNVTKFFLSIGADPRVDLRGSIVYERYKDLYDEWIKEREEREKHAWK